MGLRLIIFSSYFCRLIGLGYIILNNSLFYSSIQTYEDKFLSYSPAST